MELCKQNENNPLHLYTTDSSNKKQNKVSDGKKILSFKEASNSNEASKLQIVTKL